MLKFLENIIRDKKVLILGFGREGKSVYNTLKKIPFYKELAIADLNEIMGIDEKIYSGINYIDSIKYYDIVFKSPGVVLKKNVDIGNAIITSQVEVFIKKFNKQIIGVTGTKGKSTVSSLIYNSLMNSGKDVILAGNIGIPVFDIIDMINKDTIIVLELSCHQLEYCKASPHKAVFLNIYEEHLDHYDNFISYYFAKKNIYMHQSVTDELYCGIDVKPKLYECKSKIYIVDKNDLTFKKYDEFEDCRLIGFHNLYNLSIAFEVVKKYGISREKFIDSIKNFKPLPHRLEYIGEKNNIKFYDDSISTAVESTISAIESIVDIDTLLIGGLDRGINYGKLVDYLKKGKVRNVICMYSSGKKIYEMLKNNKIDNTYYENDLYNAIDLALNITNRQKSCVLSPAAASYGYFKNFEERGDKFKAYVFK